MIIIFVHLSLKDDFIVHECCRVERVLSDTISLPLELALCVIRFQVLLQISRQEVTWPFLIKLLEHVLFCNVDLMSADTGQLGDLLRFFLKDGSYRFGVQLLAGFLRDLDVIR